MQSARTARCALDCSMCLCSLFGRAAAVRLAVDAAAQQAAQLEAEAYERLQPLQEVIVPRLLAHGYTLGGDAYFVATEFIEVQTWFPASVRPPSWQCPLLIVLWVMLTNSQGCAIV